MSRLILPVVLLLLAACGAAERVLPDKDSLPLVYRVDIQQGNVITQEMLAQLKPGMEKTKVRHIMGTPPLVDTFHSDRWDYIYTFQEGSDARQMRRVSLYFEGDRLSRVEGDVRAAPGPMVVERKPDVEMTVPEADQRMFDKMRSTVGLGSDSKADAAARRLQEMEEEERERASREAADRNQALGLPAPEVAEEPEGAAAATPVESEAVDPDTAGEAVTVDAPASVEEADEATADAAAEAVEAEAGRSSGSEDRAPQAEEREPGFFRRMIRGLGFGSESDRDRAVTVPEQDL